MEKLRGIFQEKPRARSANREEWKKLRTMQSGMNEINVFMPEQTICWVVGVRIRRRHKRRNWNGFICRLRHVSIECRGWRECPLGREARSEKKQSRCQETDSCGWQIGCNDGKNDEDLRSIWWSTISWGLRMIRKLLCFSEQLKDLKSLHTSTFQLIFAWMPVATFLQIVSWHSGGGRETRQSSCATQPSRCGIDGAAEMRKRMGDATSSDVTRSVTPVSVILWKVVDVFRNWMQGAQNSQLRRRELSYGKREEKKNQHHKCVKNRFLNWEMSASCAAQCCHCYFFCSRRLTLIIGQPDELANKHKTT